MIIAKNDEDKRSRVWNYVTGITTVLIIIVAGYSIYPGIFRKSAGRKVEA